MRRRGCSVLAAVLLAGCGLNVKSPDLFLLTRTGPGGKLSLLVNDGGTIRCDGGRARHLSGPLLLSARDLVNSLDADARRSLRIASPTGSVYRYVVRLSEGTVAFPDTAGGGHAELAQAELFAVHAAQRACGLPG